MSRRHKAEKREINPDPKFHDLVVSKFMNSIMYEGKKSVAENIVYGLRLRKVGNDIIRKKLDAILTTTKLAPLAERYPGELSGGQQQRVALARAHLLTILEGCDPAAKLCIAL